MPPPSSSDPQYERLKLAIVSVFALYFCIGIVAEQYHYLSGNVQPPRIYPFYMWSMFARIPNAKVTYTVEISSIDGNDLMPSVHLQDSGPLLFHRSRVTDFSKRVVVELALAIERQDAREVQRLRAEFETLFENRSFRYDVVRVKVDPVAYWNTHEFSEKEILATFERL